MQPETVELIAAALQRAARSRTLISYPRFHRFFEPEDSLPSRYAALAEALRHLGDWPCVDYGALIARDNGLPGDDFFDRIRRNRPDDYAAGGPTPLASRSNASANLSPASASASMSTCNRLRGSTARQEACGAAVYHLSMWRPAPAAPRTGCTPSQAKNTRASAGGR